MLSERLSRKKSKIANESLTLKKRKWFGTYTLNWIKYVHPSAQERSPAAAAATAGGGGGGIFVPAKELKFK